MEMYVENVIVMSYNFKHDVVFERSIPHTSVFIYVTCG